MDYSPFFISIKTSFFATVIAFFVGIFFARFVSGLSLRVRGVVDVILTLPLVLPPTVVGFCLLLIFGWHSPVGQFFRWFGIRVIFSWEATVIASAVVAFPLIYRTVRASFEQADSSIIDAARTLGLSEFTIFWRILLPISAPGCVAGVVLGFARALGEFGATLMIAGNIPGRTQTIPVAIWSAVEGNEMRVAFMWAILIIAISFFIILPLNIFGGKRE
jgi:molybdate transport system permease protein